MVQERDRDIRALPSAAAHRVRCYRGWLVRAGVVLILLGLISFSLYQCARHMTVGLNTLRTQEIDDVSYISLEMYLFRDEAVITSEGNLFLHRVGNGDRVGVGDVLFESYDSPASEAELSACQTALDTTVLQMSLLQKADRQGTLADAKDISEKLDADYLAYLASTDAGNLGAALDYADRMLEGLDRYAVLTSTGVSGALTIDQVKASQVELLAGATKISEITTDRSGYFYHASDGYETIFDYAAVMTMTPADFKTITAIPAVSSATGTAEIAGKMVYSSVWYTAAYVSLEEAAYFGADEDGVRKTFIALCADSAGTEIPMTVERVVTDDEGALVVFSADVMPDGFRFERRMKVEIVSEQVSGYRIPSEALVTLTSNAGIQTQGVYILTGNVVEFRKIRVRVEREGYVIAYTYEDVAIQDAEAETGEEPSVPDDGWAYLTRNDRIITSGSGLFEGKMLG